MSGLFDDVLGPKPAAGPARKSSGLFDDVLNKPAPQPGVGDGTMLMRQEPVAQAPTAGQIQTQLRDAPFQRLPAPRGRYRPGTFVGDVVQTLAGQFLDEDTIKALDFYKGFDPNTDTGIAQAPAFERGNLGDMAIGGLARVPAVLGSALEMPVNAAGAIGDALGFQGGPATTMIREGVGTIADAARQPSELAQEVGFGQGSVTPAEVLAALNPNADAGGFLDRLGTVGTFIPETLAGSLGDMVGAIGAPIPYGIGRAEEIAQARAANDARETASLTDYGAAIPAAAIETALEKFTTGRLLPGGASATGGNALTRVAKETGVQGGSGAVEELAPYLAETLGTQTGATGQGALEALVSGLLAEGALGGAGQSITELATPRPQVAPEIVPPRAEPPVAPQEARRVEPAPMRPVRTETPSGDVLDAIPERLQPRAPQGVQVPENATRQSLVQAWRTAQTEEAKAQVAAQIAAFDARESAAADVPQAQAVEPVAAPAPVEMQAEVPAIQEQAQPEMAAPPAPPVADPMATSRRVIGTVPVTEYAGTRAAVDQAVQTGKPSDALRTIAEQPIDASYKQLATKLAPIMDDLGVKMVAAPETPRSAGEYDNVDNTLFVEVARPEILLHEALHGATSALLTSPIVGRNNADVRQIRQEMDTILAEVQAFTGMQDMRNMDPRLAEIINNPQGPLSNTKELLTYGFTDTTFQEYLRSIPAPAGIKARNAWDAFKQAVVKLLDRITGGLSRGERTMLDQLLETGGALVDFAEQNPAVARAAQRDVAQNIRDRKARVNPAQIQPDDDYRIQHRAPTRESGAPGHDITGGGEYYPDDVYSSNGPQYYGTGSEYDAQAFKIAKAIRGKPDAEVAIFRAVPADSNGEFNAGDWVSITRGYAKDHGDSVYGDGDYKVISKIVRAKDIFTNGDSIQEWGYDPQDDVDRAMIQRSDPATMREVRAEKESERQSNLNQTRADMGVPSPVPFNTETGRFARLKDMLDVARARLQDRMIALRRVQETVAPGASPAGVTTAELADAMNAYRIENLSYGRAADRYEQFERTYLQPMEVAMRRTGVSLQELEDYRLAMHAPERNARIAEINPDMPDGGSGVSTQYAQDYLAGKVEGVYSGKKLDPAKREALAALSDRLTRMRDFVLDVQVESGRITQDMADSLKKRYAHYVPLRGKEGVEPTRGTGTRGLSVVGKAIRRAFGRGEGNLAQNLVGELVADAQRAIVAAEKARVGQALLRFTLANPNDDLYVVEPVDLEYRFSEATGEAYPAVKSSGLDNESIRVPWKGKQYRIRFKDPELNRAVMQMGPQDMNGFVRVFGAWNRWQSAVLTRFNPGFAPINLFRDFIFGTTAIASERGAGTLAAAVKRYPSAMRAMYRDVRGKKSAGKMQGYAREFAAAGGKTGLTQVQDAGEITRRFEDNSRTIVQMAAEGKPITAAGTAVKRGATEVVRLIEDVNDATENALRLAVYAAERDKGVPVERAAEYAKNVTINFNRKGDFGPTLNAIYLFYNAAMQGTHAVQRVMRDPKVVAGLTGLAALQGVLAASMMDDEDDDGVTYWDEVSDYDKRTKFIIPIGALTGNPRDIVKLPMPFGFNLFTYGGGRVAQYAMLGQRDTDSSVAGDVLKTGVDAFSPVPITEGSVALVGDLPSFLMRLYANEDDLGRPITAEQAFTEYDEPRALMGKPGVGQGYETMARILARVGGGNLEERKAPVRPLDWSPEELAAITEKAFGGLANLANQGVRLFEAEDADIPKSTMERVSLTPIARTFVQRTTPERAVADRYYKQRGEIARQKDILADRLQNAADPEKALVDTLTEYPDLMGLDLKRYKDTKQNRAKGRAGEPVRTSSDGFQMEAFGGSTPQALKDAEKENKSLGRQIKVARMDSTTNAAMVQTMQDALGMSEKEARDALGLPADFDGEVPAPNRVRQRAIKALQARRREVQSKFLTEQRFGRTRQGYNPDTGEKREPGEDAE